MSKSNVEEATTVAEVETVEVSTDEESEEISSEDDESA